MKFLWFGSLVCGRCVRYLCDGVSSSMFCRCLVLLWC